MVPEPHINARGETLGNLTPSAHRGSGAMVYCGRSCDFGSWRQVVLVMFVIVSILGTFRRSAETAKFPFLRCPRKGNSQISDSDVVDKVC